MLEECAPETDANFRMIAQIQEAPRRLGAVHNTSNRPDRGIRPASAATCASRPTTEDDSRLRINIQSGSALAGPDFALEGPADVAAGLPGGEAVVEDVASQRDAGTADGRRRDLAPVDRLRRGRRMSSRPGWLRGASTIWLAGSG